MNWIHIKRIKILESHVPSLFNHISDQSCVLLKKLSLKRLNILNYIELVISYQLGLGTVKLLVRICRIGQPWLIFGSDGRLSRPALWLDCIHSNKRASKSADRRSLSRKKHTAQLSLEEEKIRTSKFLESVWRNFLIKYSEDLQSDRFFQLCLFPKNFTALW